MASNLRIGTSGWNYPSGRGTWNGVFYPPARGRAKGFDELSFYAEHFNTVEVNSTFYGQPRADVCRAWAERTPAGFEFSVKLYQKFTHPRDVQGGDDAHAAGRCRVRARRCSTRSRGRIRRTSTRSAPASSRSPPAGKMGALLAQFPPSFKDTPATRDYLADLLRAFAAYPVAVELRHRSWSDAIGDTLALLNTFGAAWVQIDEPKFKFSIRQNYLPNVKGFYYMRLHGRNVEKWWRHEKAEDRYDYLYSGEELKEFSETADAARSW